MNIAIRNIICSILLIASINSFAQSNNQSILAPADSFHSARFWGLTGGVAGIYSGTLLLLNEYWYSNYNRSSFHFFNDSREWLQMDKAGHLFNSYFISSWGVKTYEWTGLKPQKAAIAGSVAGSFLLTTIEILDGFSPKWGASWSDITANTIGSGMVLAQHLAWEEQRIRLKISAHPVTYPDDLKARTNELFGNTFAETVLKDYNAITLWASGNVYSFLPNDSKFPKWLNISIGYGAEGLFGGTENKWCNNEGQLELCSPENIIDRSDIERYRQFYIAPDIDLSQIKTGSKFVNTLLYMANSIKFPAPALEINGKGKVKLHAIYF